MQTLAVGLVLETLTATDGTTLYRVVTWIASDGSGFETEWIAR